MEEKAVFFDFEINYQTTDKTTIWHIESLLILNHFFHNLIIVQIEAFFFCVSHKNCQEMSLLSNFLMLHFNKLTQNIWKTKTKKFLILFDKNRRIHSYNQYKTPTKHPYFASVSNTQFYELESFPHTLASPPWLSDFLLLG